MKIYWEAKDVFPGLQVKKPGTMGNGAIIGYEVGFSNSKDKTLIFVDLNDGLLILKEKDAHEVAQHLTDGLYVPLEIVSRFEK